MTVLSANADQDSFGAEIRKRALILYFDAEQLEEFLGDLPVRENSFPGLLTRLFRARK